MWLPANHLWLPIYPGQTSGGTTGGVQLASSPQPTPYHQTSRVAQPPTGGVRPALSLQQTPYRQTSGIAQPTTGGEQPALSPQPTPYRQTSGGAQPTTGGERPTSSPQPTPYRQTSGGAQPTTGGDRPASSPQPTPYRRLKSNFDEIVATLSSTARAEDLADKLFSKDLIDDGLLEEAGVNTIANSKRIRPLILSVLSQVKMDPEKFAEFIEILQKLGQHELVKTIQS